MKALTRITRIAAWVLIVGLWCSFVHAAEYRAGEVIVKFAPSTKGAASAVVASEARPVVVAVDDVEAAVAELSKRDDVEYVEPNYIIEAEEIPDDWPYAGMWPQLSMEAAWDFVASCTQTSSVVVAVIDSGADLHHPDLEGVFVDGYDFVENDGYPQDNSGHGTKVCGVLGAVAGNGIGIAGVAWDVDLSIMPVKFMDKDEDGKTTGTLSDAIKAIYYAVDHGADVINASWGFYNRSGALDDAIAYARSKGVLVVASAGNKGQDNDAHDHYPSNSGLDNVVAVAALDTDGSLASFSNYGAKNVDVAAPGVGIVTTTINGGYVSWASGTSFATPFVSAISAMILSCAPGMAPGVVREVLVDACAAGPSSASFFVAGGGCVNAHSALVLAEENQALSRGGATSSDVTQSGSDSQVDAASSGSSGSSGCMIEAASGGTPASFSLALVVVLASAVLFRIRPGVDTR